MNRPAGELLHKRERRHPDSLDGHGLVARSLKALGVTHAYGLSGTPISDTLAHCGRLGIRVIGVRHQQGGVMMATAQNYISGRLCAVTLLSAGPAVTNAATGILVAKDNCWPIVVLGGRRPLSMRGMGSFQDLDGVSLYRSITKWADLVETTARIPDALEQAFRIATTGRPGPVYLDLPEDVLTGIVHTYHVPSPPLLQPPAVDSHAVARAAEILAQADRPAIIAGKGVRWSEAYQELARLVDEFGIPFITSPMGRGYLPDDHPLCYNAVRGLVQSEADAVLLIGARLDWTFRFGSEISPSAKIIQIDIDEQEIGVNVAPAVGIVGDAKAVLDRLLRDLTRNEDIHAGDKLASWYRLLNEAKEKKRRAPNSFARSDSLPMSPYRMLEELAHCLPRDAICILDGNISMAAAQHVLPSLMPASRFTAGSNGCMGVGIPFAVGAKVAQPDRLVIAVCGDTAFAFNAMEMETAVRHRIPVIVVVANNDGMSGALVQKALYAPDHERVTMFQPEIRYEALMRAFGGHAEFVEVPEELTSALERARASGVAACINIKVDPDTPYPPN